jgi:filamentous hemagglutinin family protein
MKPVFYKRRMVVSAYLQLMLWAAFCVMPTQLRGNPTGGQVVAGGAGINASGNTLTVTQSTDRAVIHWQNFSIGAGEVTKFVQPGINSAALNRVMGSNLSEIYGTLEANGKVYLINPNGVMIGSGGVVNTAGFVASTLDLNDGEFMIGGDLHFRGNSAGKVVNYGKISALEGDVILIAREVDNAGELRAGKGTVGLVGGTDVLLKASGEQKLFIQPSSGSVRNTGLIQAAVAELKAAGGNEYALAINNSGIVRAVGVENREGKIWLVSKNGATSHTGTLQARKSDGTGGFIETSGRQVYLPGVLDAGDGGTWLIDPYNIDVVAGNGLVGIGGAPGFVPSASSQIGADQIVTQLNAGTSVVLDTGGIGSPGADAGNITVNAAVVKTGVNAAGLTLRAANDITINQAISVGSGTLALEAGGSITATGGALTTDLLMLQTGTAGSANIQTAAHNVTVVQTTGSGIGSGGLIFRQTRAGGISIGNLSSRGSVSINDGQGVVVLTGTLDTSLAGGANATLTASANSVNINGQINAGSGQVALLAQQAVAQANTGAGITADSLRGQSTAGSVSLNPTGTGASDVNTVNTFAGVSNTGNVSFRSNGSFNIGKVNNTDGINASGTVSLTVNQAGGAITQTAGADGKLTAGTLNITTNSGNVTLGNTTNNVGALGTVGLGGGQFTFVNATGGSFNIGGGLTANGGISVTNQNGNLTTSAAVSSDGNIVLRSVTGTVTLGGTVTSNNNGVTLRSNGALDTGTFLVSAPTAVTGDVSLISDASTVTIGGGGVTVGDTLGIQIGPGLTLNIAGAVTATSVHLVADQIDISANINATGTISLAPVTAGTAVALGGAAAPGFVIDSAELSFLTSAGTLEIGRNLAGTTTAGAVTVAAATAANNVLNLFTSNGVTQMGVLTIGGGSGALNITAGGTVSLGQFGSGVGIGSVSGSTTSGHFLIIQAADQNLTVNGVTVNGGDIVIRNFERDLTVAGPLVSNGGNIAVGANLGTTAALRLEGEVNAGTGTVFTFSRDGTTQTAAGIVRAANLHAQNFSSGSLSLTADNGVTGNVKLANSGGNVAFTNTVGFQLGGVSSLSTPIGTFSTSSFGLQTGNGGTATLTVGGNVTQAAGGTNILSAGTLNVARFGSANPTVTLDNAGNQVTNLGTVSLGTGAFTLNDTGGLAITGAATAGGGYSVTTSGGNLTQNLGASINASGGDVTLASSGDLTVNAGVTANSGSGRVTLRSTAGSVIEQTSGVLTGARLEATAANNVDIAQTSNNVGSGGVAASATNGFVVFINNAAILVDQVGTTSGVTAGGTAVLATTSGDITQTANGIITAAALGFAASNGSVVMDQANQIAGNFAVVNTANGNVTLRNTGNVNIGDVGPITTAGLSVPLLNGISASTAANRFVSLQSDAGAITQSGGAGSAIVGSELRVQTNNQNATLANASNRLTGVGVSALGSGRLEVFDSVGDLTVNGAVTANGGVQIQTQANLILDSGTVITANVAGDSVVLAGANFINDAGSGAVLPGAGRFLIYSTSPASNTFGGLASGQQALYGRTFAGNPPGTVTETGNRYLFSEGLGALTLNSAFDDTKVYGSVYNPPAAVVGTHYTLSGFVDASAYGDVFTQDTAANIGLTGAPTFASAGDGEAANVVGSPYAFVWSNGTLANTSGYTLGTPSTTGALTVTPATVTITGGDFSRFLGQPNPVLGGTVIGLPSVATLNNLLYTTMADLASLPGDYAVTPSADADSNLALVFVDGTLTVLSSFGPNLNLDPFLDDPAFKTVADLYGRLEYPEQVLRRGPHFQASQGLRSFRYGPWVKPNGVLAAGSSYSVAP